MIVLEGWRAHIAARVRPTVLSSLPLLFLLFVWFILTASGAVDPVFLPSPVHTARSFLALLSIDFLKGQLLPSLLRIAGAFLISVVLAFPTGLVAGQVPL